MVTALSLQKLYLPLAELEPQLWYKPFPVEAYQRVLEAEEAVSAGGAGGRVHP